MSYINDPREMAIKPEGGAILEQDNRHETMYQWGSMVLDLCDLPVSEYMKPMTVIVYGNGEYEPEVPGTTLKTENVKIWFTVLKNGNEVTNEPEVILGADENTEIVWTARWEWIGSFTNQIQVAAVVQTEKGTYDVSAILNDNNEKRHEEEIIEAKGSEVVESYKSYGVASTETPVEQVTGTTYTETVEEENTKYNFEISSAETIVYLTLKLVGVNSYTNMEMRYGDEIPFDKVNVDKEGYTLLYWVDSKGKEFTGTTMPATNLTLTAKYEAKKCKVDFVYVVDGVEELVSSTTVSYGAKVTKFPSTSMSGYDFKGWEPATSTIIKEDTVFKATFESKKYTVTWSGYTDGPFVQEYKYGEILIEPTLPEKEGYTFVKWDKALPETVTTNLKFTAVFNINQYVISYYEEWFGVKTELSAFTKNYNTTISHPSLPTQKGYTYSAWGGEYTGKTVPAYNIEYVTTKTVNSYTIAYFDNGELVHTETYEYMAPITPYEYKKEGWVVSEWTNLPETMPYNNVSAHCTTEIMRFTVMFVDQDGNVLSINENVPYGTMAADLKPEVPEGYSYSFDEIVNEMVKDDMTINVVKTKNFYNVTINGNIVSLEYETDIEKYVRDNFIPEEGYHLTIESITHTTVPANDSAVVVYVMEANIWVLTYSTEGAEENLKGTIEVAYGTNILPLLPPTEKEGYDFSGWYNNDIMITENDTMPNEDLSVNGTYQVEMYAVTIYDGEDVKFEGIYPYGTMIENILTNDAIVSFIESESAAGYTVNFFYNGEEVDSTKPITEDIALTINRTPNVYTLIFKNGDEVLSETKVAYGDAIVYPTVSNKTENGVEYVFVWEDSSYKTMPANDLTIIGNYQEKAEAPIYYGSFVIPVSSYTADELSGYVNDEDLESNYFQTVAVAECVGTEKALEFIYPAYEPFTGLTNVKLSQEKKKYYEPLTVLLPISVVEKYSISLKDGALGTERWGYMVTDNKVKTIKGNDYYVFAIADDGTRADKVEKIYKYKMQLTEK